MRKQDEDGTEGKVGKKRVHRITKRKRRGKKMELKEK
jgi:hypothetical protein